MSMSAKVRRAPMRIATGAYILNSGVTKLGADDDAAKSLHGMASGTYGFLGKADPKVLAKALGAGEIAVGAALLLPVVPAFVAGAALAGFSGALLNMYWNTPGLHQEGSPRPTPQGMPIAKDVWMLGIGVGLMADAALEPAHDRVIELETTVSRKRAARKGASGRSARKAARRARKAKAHYVDQARTTALEFSDEAAKRARKARRQTAKRATKASESAAERLAELRDEYAPVALDKARAAREAARQAAQEYGPVAADKARAARDAARELAEEYGPVAAEKARAAREAARLAAQEYGPVAADKARAARDAARELAEEYGPVAADKAKVARHLAQEYSAKAQKYGAKARERVTS